MKILFIPCRGAVLPHLLPLLALSSRLAGTRHESAFLAPKAVHEDLKRRKYNVLDIDYTLENMFRLEMQAYGKFRPDIVVDDLSPTTLLATALTGKPRVAIRRTGVFPGAVPRNPTHHHSMVHFLTPSMDDTQINNQFVSTYRNSSAVCGVEAPRNLAEMCAADMNVVPGIESIEPLPPQLRGDPTYVYAGPLILQDSSLAKSPPRVSELSEFFERNRKRRIVYLTLGTVLEAADEIPEMLKYVLTTGVAVISNVKVEGLSPAQSETFMHAKFLPMDIVCAKVYLMIHHCGSGTYQYAIKHKLPAICLGSRCYDRDDVAQRLQELGVAQYVPDATEAPQFADRFRRVFEKCLSDADNWYQSAKENLELLNAENDRTAAAFDFEAVLRKAVSLRSRKKIRSN